MANENHHVKEDIAKENEKKRTSEFRNYLSYSFYSCGKKATWRAKNLFQFVVLYHSPLLKVVRAGTLVGQELKGTSWCRGHGRMLLAGLLPTACSACFLIALRQFFFQPWGPHPFRSHIWDSYIMIHESSKITVMKYHWNNFVVGSHHNMRNCIAALGRLRSTAKQHQPGVAVTTVS